jgi:hypothetical protein
MSVQQPYSRWRAFLACVRCYPRRTWRLVWSDPKNGPAGIVFIVVAVFCAPIWAWEFLKARYLGPIWEELWYHYWEYPRAVKADEAVQRLARFYAKTVACARHGTEDKDCDLFDECHYTLSMLLGHEASDHQSDAVFRAAERQLEEGLR